MNKDINILLVLQEEPYSRSNGGWQRTRLMMDALSQIGNVYEVYFGEDTSKCTGDGRTRCISVREPVFRRKLETLLERSSLLEFVSLRTNIRKHIEDVFPDVKFQLIVCRYIHNFARFHIWESGVPTLVDIDDHPLQLFDTTESTRRYNWLHRTVLRKILQKQMTALEDKTQGVWISNPENLQLFHRQINVRVLKNIAHLPSPGFRRNTIPAKCLLTVGQMGYGPNYYGVIRFIKGMWSVIHNLHPDMTYLIAGASAPQELMDLCIDTPGVTYLGYVDDLEELYSKCTATVVPIYEGSGTCIKVLESLAYGVPCITSPFGCRGIEYEGCLSDIGLYTYCNREEFKDNLSEIMSITNHDAKSQAMQTFISQNYSKQEFFSSVRQLVKSVITF